MAAQDVFELSEMLGVGYASIVKPAQVSEELLAEAHAKADELFASLVTAKNEWQYAVKDQDAKYQRVLQIKAEYAEWRRLVERLTEILDGRHTKPAAIMPAARSGSGFAVPSLPANPRRVRTAS